MNRIENDMHTTNGMSTKTHKSFPIHYGLWEGEFLKRILTYLYCTKYYDINRCTLNIQKHVFYKKKSYKNYKYSNLAHSEVFR